MENKKIKIIVSVLAVVTVIGTIALGVLSHKTRGNGNMDEENEEGSPKGEPNVEEIPPIKEPGVVNKPEEKPGLDVSEMGRNPAPEVVDTEIRIDTKEDEDGAQ